MFIFVYFVPLLVIFITSFGLIIIVKRNNNMDGTKSCQRIQNEKKLTISMMIVTGNNSSIISTSNHLIKKKKIINYLKGTYIFSWTPYAIVTFYVAFVACDEALETLSPMGMTLPAIFAKSSICITPVSIIFTNTKIYEKFNRHMLSYQSPGMIARKSIASSSIKRKSLAGSMRRKSEGATLIEKEKKKEAHEKAQHQKPPTIAAALAAASGVVVSVEKKKQLKNDSEGANSKILIHYVN
jgi:uncharacterized membrane protein